MIAGFSKLRVNGKSFDIGVLFKVGSIWKALGVDIGNESVRARGEWKAQTAVPLDRVNRMRRYSEMSGADRHHGRMALVIGRGETSFDAVRALEVSLAKLMNGESAEYEKLEESPFEFFEMTD